MSKDEQISNQTEKMSDDNNRDQLFKNEIPRDEKENRKTARYCNELETKNEDLKKEKDRLVQDLYAIQNAKLWRIPQIISALLNKLKGIFGFSKPGIQASVFVRTVRFLKKHGIWSTIGRIHVELVGYKPQRRRKKNARSTMAAVSNRNRKTKGLSFIHDDSVSTETLETQVSVVIPTKNGGQDFGRLMKMLNQQKGFREIEIVIVDSGSSDSTVEIAKQYGAKVIEILPEEFSHSYARNLGVQKAQGEYVLVMTQDAMPTSLFWIRNFYHALTHQSNIAAVSCGEFPRLDADLYHRAFTWNHYKFLGSYENDVINEYPKSNDSEMLHKAAQLSDIACFMKRETAKKYPYQGAFAEDLDLGMRLLKDGYKVGFLGHELAIHSHKRTAYYYLKRRFVEFITLKKLLPNQRYIRTEYIELMHETLCIMGLLEQFFEQLGAMDLSQGITYKMFRDAVVSGYRKLGKLEYRQCAVPTIKDIDWLDVQTKDMIAELLQDTHVPKTLVIPQDGTMLLALEGYINILLNYMAECYEYVNEEVYWEFKDCIGKVFAGVIGTYLAYCSLTEADEDTTDEAHQKCYQRIGAGV